MVFTKSILNSFFFSFSSLLFLFSPLSCIVVKACRYSLNGGSRLSKFALNSACVRSRTLITSDNVESVHFADVDNDGELDLFIASGTTLALKHNGFASFSSFPMPSGSSGVNEGSSIADINGDSFPDVLSTAIETSNEMVAFISSGKFFSESERGRKREVEEKN